MGLVVLVSLFFAVSRFWAPGHAVSLWGGWEAFAHLWMGVVLTLFLQRLPPWGKDSEGSDEGYPWLLLDERFPWVLFVCWFVPSMIELVLFLVGPFNPAR